jgi:hypothetical protein
MSMPFTGLYSKTDGTMNARVLCLVLSIAIISTQIAGGTHDDNNNNCPDFVQCCTITGVCPSSSCVTSLGADNDARANCNNKCRQQVECVPLVPSCAFTNNKCLGTVKCLDDDCDGRKYGNVCLFTGSSRGQRKNFKICNNIRVPNTKPTTFGCVPLKIAYRPEV